MASGSTRGKSGSLKPTRWKTKNRGKLKLTTACQKGRAEACNNLGVAYDKGTGVTQDYAKAVELYRKACDGQEAGGCFNLGVTYATGIGVRQSDDEARKFLGKACDLKSESGCTQYARLKTEKK